jgi:hypothetical protein
MPVPALDTAGHSTENPHQEIAIRDEFASIQELLGICFSAA